MSTRPAPTDAGRPAAIAELAAEYAARRDPEALHRLRRTVRRDHTYRPDLDLLREAASLLEHGAHAEIVKTVRAEMPGAFFSPRAHVLLATAYEALGDATRAQRERRTARLALTSILSSGDGSAERPWSVLRVSDEYDVLRARGRASRTQRLVTRDGRELDHHLCDDGTEAWFDVGLLGLRGRA